MLKVKQCPIYMYEVYSIKLNFNIVDLTKKQKYFDLLSGHQPQNMASSTDVSQ
jgi:hypothetical protein